MFPKGIYSPLAGNKGGQRPPYKSILVTHNAVFVIETVIWAGIICSLKKACHFVLIKVDHAGVAIVVVIIDVICTSFAVCRGLLFHSDILHGERGNGIKALVRSNAGKKIVASLTGNHCSVITA